MQMVEKLVNAQNIPLGDQAIQLMGWACGVLLNSICPLESQIL